MLQKRSEELLKADATTAATVLADLITDILEHDFYMTGARD